MIARAFGQMLRGWQTRAATKWTTGHPATDRALSFMGAPTTSGIDVTADSALTYSAVWAATRLLSGTGSSLPLNVYRPGGEGKIVAYGTRLQTILHDAPNPEMSSMMFRSQAIACQVNAGNTYAEIERSGKQVENLWPIHPSRVRLERIDDNGMRNARGRLVYFVYNNDAPPTPIEAADMFHVPSMMSRDGISGMGVISFARQTIGAGLAEEQHAAAYFGNGAIPPILVTHPNKMTPEARKNFRQEWKEIHGGAENAYEVAILSEGSDIKVLGINAKDSQFIESRQFSIEEIARWYGVPQHMIGHLLRSTNNNIEHQGIEFVVYSLIPWLKLWEQEIWRKLLTDEERAAGWYAKHVVDALLRGDAASRAAALQAQFQHGALNLDEWREIEDRNPLPDGKGKTFFTMANLTTVERMIDGTVNQTGNAAAVTMPPVEDDDADDESEDERSVRVKAATLAVLHDAMSRMVAKEIEAAEKAANAPAEFMTRLDKIYEGHGPRMAIALRAPMAACYASHDAGQWEDSLADDAAGVHIAESRGQLLTASECQPDQLAASVAARVSTWAEQRTKLDWRAEPCHV